MVKFATDENLGKVVQNNKTTVWCFGVDPIKSMYDLRFAGGANKFGSLCAFKFTSFENFNDYIHFQIAFVTKSRSLKFHRQSVDDPKMFHHDLDTTGSKWYIMKSVDFARVDILDKKSCFINYGFDVDKFFDSDMFKIMITRIKSTIQRGLVQTRNFIKELTSPKDKEEAQRLIAAIESSLPRIHLPIVNDKYYELKQFAVASNQLDATPEVRDNLLDSDSDKELDEKIEQELTRRGIYADLNSQLDNK